MSHCTWESLGPSSVMDGAVVTRHVPPSPVSVDPPNDRGGSVDR